MQTILGAGGAIGVELARALGEHTGHIRLVGRSPQAVNVDDKLFAADLTRADETFRAVEGSRVAYLTVGLPYDTKLWQSTWPVLMRNVIDACRTHDCKLVFFDNVYMYDPACMPHMTEETPIAPSGNKGKLRAGLARMLLDAVDKGQIQALIARSADFYGPSIKGTSLLIETVFNRLAAGRKANWLASVDYRHSFTYTPDAGRATALLGNTADAFNQVWHLPTSANPPTGREWIEAIAEALGKEPGYQLAGKALVRLLGLFMPVMRETVEMMYQFDRDYVFDSSRFSARFGVAPTPYIDGIREIVNRDYGFQAPPNRNE